MTDATIPPETFLRHLFDTAVATADPMRIIPDCLPEKPAGRVVVVGAGKASARMAEAVETSWGPCEGLVLTRYGYQRPCKGIEILQAAHPVCDAAGIAATQRILALLDSLTPGDFVLTLISGGGSALLCAPAGDMGLADKQAVNRALLASGAPIAQMNVVRKHLSRVKGGQLAAATKARMLVLMISDVAGDNPADIASGVTVGESSSAGEARAILDEYHIRLPDSAEHALQHSTVVPPNDPRLARVENRVIAAPSASLAAAAEQARQRGLQVEILGDAIEGEAREEAARQIALARQRQKALQPDDPPLLLLSGGECTVTRRGDGIGGPNAEFTLAALIELQGQSGIWVLAGDTDGVDGAAEVAGACIGPDSLQQAADSGLDATAALAGNDSHNFFAALGKQIVTGPTLTNVNDFRAILVCPSPATQR